MIVRDFISEVTRREGKKKQISVAQTSEVAKIMDDMLDGELYPLIRKLKLKKKKAKNSRCVNKMYRI